MTLFPPPDFHSSRDPAGVRQRFLESLQKREMDHQFHYVSALQAERWLALHQRYSPSRQDPDCERIYREAFARCAEESKGAAQVVGLGCGGGRKDAWLIQALRVREGRLRYTAADVSHSLVDEARQHVKNLHGPSLNSLRGLVADFMAATDLEDYWRREGESGERQIFSFLGMLPNFDPDQALSLISGWLNPEDLLVVSANLAPGDDYEAGCRAVLPQYDNEETRRWLFTVLEELGCTGDPSDLHFRVRDAGEVKRIECHYEFPEDDPITFENHSFDYKKGEKFRLFYSNRFRPEILEQKFQRQHLEVLGKYLTRSGEEGVWVVAKRTVP